jgi:hypothetical protein
MSELIIKVEWHSPVQINYQCCKIITQEDWERIQEVIESDIELSYSNAPKWWEESFRSKELKKAFIIYSGPDYDDPHSDTRISVKDHKKRLAAFRKLFPNGEIGDTSIIHSVLDAELNSDDGVDFEQLNDDGEEDEESPVLTKEQESPKGMSKILTKGIVEKVLRQDEEAGFDEFTSIKDDAAEILSKHDDLIWLNGLEKISAEAFHSLSSHQGGIQLMGLKEITDELAKSLAKYNGDLWLNLGVYGRGSRSKIDKTAAISLSKHQGEINGMNAKELVNSLKFLKLNL